MAGIEKILKDRQGRSLLPVTGSEQVYRPGGRSTVEDFISDYKAQNYEQNGFLISPFSIKVTGLRYVGFREVKNDSTAYILTMERCLKFDFLTFKVYWDVEIPTVSYSWHSSAYSLRVIENDVCIIVSKYAGSIENNRFNLVRLNDADGTVIDWKEIPISTNFLYFNIVRRGEPLITKDSVFAYDAFKKKVVGCNLHTMDITELTEQYTKTEYYLFNQRLSIVDEAGNYKTVIINSNGDKKLYVTDEKGYTFEIEVNNQLPGWTRNVYFINLQSKQIRLKVAQWIQVGTIEKISENKYAVSTTNRKNTGISTTDRYPVNEFNRNITQSLLYDDILNEVNNRPLSNFYKGCNFYPYKSGFAIVADALSNDANLLANLTISGGGRFLKTKLSSKAA